MMKTRRILLAVMLLVATTAHAQWRAGVTAGADYNIHSMDLQYMNDFQLEGRWGATLGVTGQYDFYDWLGVRADLNWLQKDYRLYRNRVSYVDHKYRNNYLQLPVMASFSVGSKKLRGFCNLGVYGGYWLNSSRMGSDQNSFSERMYEFSEEVQLDSDLANRHYNNVETWDNIDLYMPFCAPFPEGTTASCDDLKIGQYLYNDSGKGYEAGSVEEKATAGITETYFSRLFDKFCYVPFKKWASLVPDVDAALAPASNAQEKGNK